MALAQIEHLIAQGAPKHCVLADAGYGVDTAFREGLSDLGPLYGAAGSGSRPGGHTVTAPVTPTT